MRNTLLAALAVAAISIPVLVIDTASAHPGAVNAQGCHRDRKHGTSHCHKPGELMTMRSGRRFVPCRYCGHGPRKARVTDGNGVERGSVARTVKIRRRGTGGITDDGRIGR